MKTLETIEASEAYLAANGLRLKAIVIGGAALNLLGVISRATKDCDIIHPLLPPEVAAAARSFAIEQRAHFGPAALTKALPPGWEERVQRVFKGQAIELGSLGRLDLLRSKLFALCDRAIDLGDCVALAPSSTELQQILPWLEIQDANPDWPAHVRATLLDVGRRLGHGL